MRRFLIRAVAVGFTLALFHFASGLAQSQDGRLISREQYAFPPYPDVPGLGLYAARDEYRKAVEENRYCFQKLWYRSDGLRVGAYLYAPCERKGQKLPAVIFSHGGFSAGELAPSLLTLFHRLAGAGFVVLAPLYRGNAGGEGKDEAGGPDLDDLLNVRPLAESLGFIDMENLFLYGESRGGMMTFQAIRDGFPAKAAAVFGAFSSLGDLIAAKPQRYEPAVRALWPDFQIHRAAILRRRSAMQWSQALDVPLLLMHGGADQSVDALQTLRLATALQLLGKEYSLVIFAGDNHVLTRHRRQRDENAIDWFKTHLAR